MLCMLNLLFMGRKEEKRRIASGNLVNTKLGTSRDSESRLKVDRTGSGRLRATIKLLADTAARLDSQPVLYSKGLLQPFS